MKNIPRWFAKKESLLQPPANPEEAYSSLLGLFAACWNKQSHDLEIKKVGNRNELIVKKQEVRDYISKCLSMLGITSNDPNDDAYLWMIHAITEVSRSSDAPDKILDFSRFPYQWKEWLFLQQQLLALFPYYDGYDKENSCIKSFFSGFTTRYKDEFLDLVDSLPSKAEPLKTAVLHLFGSEVLNWI